VIRALIFDFDGLILETEMPAYQSWLELYREHGQDLTREVWADYIGRESGWFEPAAYLESLVGGAFNRDAIQARRDARKTELVAALETMAGVREWIADARALGLRLAVASSSRRAWVWSHLERLRLDGWDAVVCREDVERAKPAPDLYLRACELVGVAPREALAIEDSPNGVASAQAAGLRVVAVPNELTKGLDLERADCRLESCADLPLADLLARFR
jgi:HAD superfamily hydrolase (TIGR01509 family)